MAYEKFGVSDNAVGNLASGITGATTTITLGTSEGALFPAGQQFIGTIVQYVIPADPTSGVSKREKVLVTNRTGDILTVTRGYDGDVATTFNASDFFYLNVTSKVIEDIQDEVTRLETDKLNLSGGTLTDVLIEANGVSIASATTTDLAGMSGNTAHITGTTTITSFGSVINGARFTLVFDGALLLTHHATNLILPTGADITTVAGDTIEVLGDNTGWRVTDYQRVNGEPLTAPTISKVKFGGTGADGNLTISSGTTTVTLSSDFIEKNYENINISGTAILDIVGNSGNNGSVAVIKCKSNFTMSAGTIQMNGQGGKGGVGVGFSTNPGSNGTSNIVPTILYGVGATAGIAGATGLGLGSYNVQQIKKYLSGILYKGGGASSGTGQGADAGGTGGAGGGLLIIEVGGAINFTGGTIQSNGGAGETGGTLRGGGGGGGGGGNIIIYYNTLTSISGTIKCDGGAGGAGGTSGTSPGGVGGGGGAGYSNGGAGGNNAVGNAGTSNSWGTGGAAGGRTGGAGGGGGGGAGYYLTILNTEIA